MNGRKEIYTVAKIFFANKALLIITSVLAMLFIPLGTGYQMNTKSMINPWTQWDGEAYLTIAEKWYVTLADGRSLHNFLPLYPLFIRGFGFIVGDLAIAAFILSAVFAFIASCFLFKLAELELGEGVAKKTVILLLFFPTAFFFSAVYTESLFLSLAVASFYYARRGNWLVSGILAAALPFVRIVGLFFWFVLIAEYLLQNKSPVNKNAFGLVAALSGVALFFVFSILNTGSVFGYANQQNLWTRSISSPHVALINAFVLLSMGPILAAYSLWNLAVLAFFVLTFYHAARYMRKSYSVYMFFVMALPFFSSTLEGLSRFILLCFPSFMILAKFLDKKKEFYLPALFISAFLLVVLTARFVTGAVGTLFGV